MKKLQKDIHKELPTDFGAVGQMLDDASIDLPKKFDSLIDSIENGFMEFLSPPCIEID